ncbi:Hypothetical predicted protein [Paramuricea clavata]|uniref:Uncharacterized protein n=1 Tax=Paramuricea clavata TaxID=317549 RepID=A0A7D9JRA6_PARCT|nr:Hypothetical predicted protein [Paramuricea clavata]
MRTAWWFYLSTSCKMLIKILRKISFFFSQADRNKVEVSVMNSARILFLYLLLLYTKTCNSLHSSALFKLSMSGYRLCDHVISEHNTLNFLECSLYCLRKPSHCKSINYKARKHQHPSNNCQLNNATKTTHPQNLLPDKNYDYYQPLEKPEKKIEKIKKVEEQEQVEEPVNYAKSCDDLYKSGKTTTGVYTIDPDGLGPFAVRCDMETTTGVNTIDPDGLGAFAVRCDMETTSTSGRGWTIFQRRVDGSLSFYRKWYGYKIGFGDLSGEFWLGLDKIHRLTASGQNVLRVDLESFENEAAYAVYESFSVGNESNAYILNVGNYSGNNT